MYQDLAEAFEYELFCFPQMAERVFCPDYYTYCYEIRGIEIAVENGKHRERISRFGMHYPEQLKSYSDSICKGTEDGDVRDGKRPYTYHNRMYLQTAEAVRVLQSNPDSRRAVITVRDALDILEDDQPCLTYISLLIRNGKLEMFTHWRSNDLWQAFYSNAYALMELQQILADELAVEVGDYHHYVDSLHVYERNWAEVVAAEQSINKGARSWMTAEEYWEAL